jgi:O-antigen/teichoic acid export membrane protein
LLAVTVPAVITSAGLRGLLEAHQRFDFVTYLRIPMGVFTFAGPLAVLPFSNNLAAVVGVLVAGRFAGLAASFWFCLRVAPELRRQVAWHGPSAGPLLRFGGWMTVSNVVGPMMLYMDRFVIGALVSAAAVAYYATPYEVVTKLLFIPGALVNVMFPAFSTTFGQDGNRTRRLYGHCVKFLIVILLPAVLPIIVFARTGLTIWLGTDFASHSFRVLQWLAVGVLLNSLAQLPFALVQGVGRPDLTAKLHLIELPGYLLALLLLIHAVGIEGAAVAWTARVGVDAAILFVIARRLVPRGVPIVAGAELEAERELGNTRLAAES